MAKNFHYPQLEGSLPAEIGFDSVRKCQFLQDWSWWLLKPWVSKETSTWISNDNNVNHNDKSYFLLLTFYCVSSMYKKL